MKTNELHPTSPANLPRLTAAVVFHLNAADTPAGNHAARASAAVSSPNCPTGIHTPQHAVVDWQDLSTTAPGAAARERANAERSAAPVRVALARVLRVHTEERAWRIGAAGEEAVAEQLAKLDSAWRVIHAVPVGTKGSDIDHIVIGPPGVFTVNAKNHPHGKVWVGGNTLIVNGQRTFYVRNSRHEAARAARLLTAAAGRRVQVKAIIAIVGDQRGITVKEQPRDGEVHVVARKKITKYLTSLPPRLSPDEVDALHILACRSTTWQPPQRGHAPAK